MSDYLLPRIHYSNAELEDQILEMIYDHDPTLFTTFTNVSGPKVEITIGGITKRLSVNADKLDGYHAYSFVLVSDLASHLNESSYVSKAELSAEAYLKKAGGTMTGDINFTSTGNAISGEGITFKHSSTNDAHISAVTNGALGIYGRSKVVLIPSFSQSVGLEVTASDLKYNDGDVLHVGNLKNHQFTNSAYGVLLSYAPPSKTASQLGLKATSTVNRYYGVVATKNGYAYVNVPWTDDYVTDFQKSELDAGIDFSISMKSGNSFSNSIPMINQDTWGVAKTPFESTDAITVEELNSYNDTGRWYGVHTLKSGYLVVNVPWVDTAPNIGNHYSPTNFTNSFTSFGKFLQGTPSYAIVGMSYSFDSKRHIGIISYSYSKIDANNTYIRSAYFKNENTGYTLYMAYALNTTSTIGYVKTTIPKMTNLSYGVAKTYHANMTTNVTVQSLPASPTTDRWYGATLTKDGKLIVNVPWTDDFVTSIDYGDAEDGITTKLGRNLSDELKATIPAITLNEYGVAKLAFDCARDVQFSSVQSGSNPSADRWYGIQALKDGSLVTNIPWTDYQTSISGHYAPNSFGNKYDKFGKFVTGTTSYAISGVSYSFDNKRHVGIMSYSYSLINADTLDGKHASYFSISSHNHDDQYLQLSGGTITGNLAVNGNTTLGNAAGDRLKINGITTAYGDVILRSESGDSPSLVFYRGSTLTDWRAYVSAGQLTLASSTDAINWTRKIWIEDQSSNLHATLKGNADTATTLATTRTLWGQNFNGSANVTGDMSSVGSISASGNIITEKSGTTAVRVSTKNSNGEVGIYTSINRGLYDFTSGKWLIAYNAASAYTFLGDGNVGIGCEPDAKLDVNGQIKSRAANGTAPFVVESTTKVDRLNADMLDGRHAYYFAPYEQTFGTVGNFVNGINNSNHIARGDLGLVGFDNTGVIVDIYEAAPGSEYDSTPSKTITSSDITYGDAFKKGLSSRELHVAHAGASLKIVITTEYVKAVGLFISTRGNTMNYKSTVGNTTNTGEFSTYGSWFIFTVDMEGNHRTAEIELNTTNEDYELTLFGIRTYVTNPFNYRFPGIANTADSATVSQHLSDGAKGSILYQTAPSTTGMLAIGNQNQVLAVNGTGSNRLPAWKNINDIHNHDDRYVTDIGTFGNLVTWTKNDITTMITVPYATKAGTAEKVTISTNSKNAAYNIVFNSGNTLYSDSDIQLNPSTGEVTAYHFTVTHADCGGNEFRVKYSTTVDMAMMIGSGNTNHGLYDIKNSKWMIVADAEGNVTMNGNATTATTLATTRTLWGQNFNGSANVTGNMTSVGSISASGNIITEKSDTTSLRVSTKNSNGEVGIYTSTNRGLYDFTSGKWLIAYNVASAYTFLGDGDVGIGCEPDVKLDVNGQIKSRAANGTAPFVVASTTKVDNLNADLLDGEHSYTLRSRPDNGGDVLFSMIPYINARVNPFSKAVDIDVSPADAPFGYCFGPITDYVTYVSGYIPVMPGDIIRGEIHAYRDVGATGTNTGVLYCGISKYDRNKKPIASNNGNQYFVASNSTVPSDGIWHKYSGTVTIPTEHTIYNGSDGGGVYYIKIVFYVNYNHNSAPPTYIGGCQFTRLNPFYDVRYVTKSELSAQSYLKTSGGTMTGAINRIYDSASDDPILNIASSNQDIWLWRVRSADSGTSSSVDKVYGFGTKYLGTGTGNNNSWAMYADNQNGTQIKALEMKQSGDLFAYAPIHWANATALPEDTSPQYILTTDSFANGGKTKWTSIANLSTAVGFAVGSYLPLAGGTMTGDINFTSTGSAMTGTGLSFYTSSNKDAHISAATNWGLGLYGAGNVAIRPSLSDSTVGITMTTTDLKYNGGDILHVGNLQNHQFTNSAYGVLLSYAPPTKTSSQLGLKATNVANRYYGVVATKNGYAYVNVPWTDDYINGFIYDEDPGTGIITKISTALGNSLGDTISVMNPDKLGVANTAWNRTPDIADSGNLTTEPDYGHTRVDRWYGVQLTKEKDQLVVYVPWTDTNHNTTSQAGHYSPNDFDNKYSQFGKYSSTAITYAITGMSYSFDSKRHIGIVSYSYSKVATENTYIRTTYFTTHTNVKGLQVNITYGTTASPTTYVTYNNSRPVIPVADDSSYGVIKVSRTSTITKSTITGTTSESSTTQRYLVSMTTDGFAYVGVPWTDTNTKVTQKQATGNATYSLLMRYTAGTGTSDDTNFAYFDTSLKYNAALNALTNEGGSYFATTSGWVDVGTASHSSNFHTYGNATIEEAAYVKSGHAYIGSGTGSQCHQQYDATNKCLKFIFD